jgi:glycine/serine hydroxymethyltransferase
MKEAEVGEIAQLIATTLKDDSPATKEKVSTRVKELTTRFRPYPDVE